MNYSFEFETLISIDEDREDLTVYIAVDGYQPREDWDNPDVVITSITDEDGTDLTNEVDSELLKQLEGEAYDALWSESCDRRIV